MRSKILVPLAILAMLSGCAGGKYQNESRVSERIIVEKPQVVKERVIVETPDADYYYKESSRSTGSETVDGIEQRTYEYREYNR